MVLLKALPKIFQILSPRGRIRFCRLALVTFISALIETAGIAAWAPFVSFATNPGILEQNPWFQRLYRFMDLKDPGSFLLFLGICVLVLFLAGNGCRAVTVWMCYRFSWGENHRISERLLQNYLRRPYRWFLQHNSTDLAKNVIDEVANVVVDVIQRLCMFMVRGFLTALICIGLFLIDPFIALATALCLSLVYSLFYRVFRKRLARRGDIRFEANGLRYKTVLEAISSIKEAKAPLSRDHFLKVYRGHSKRYSSLMISSEMIGDLPGYLTEALTVGGMLAVMIYFLATKGGAGSAIPLIVLYIVAAIRLAPALQEMYRDLVKIRFYLPALERIHEELQECGLLIDFTHDVQRLRFEQTIALESVCYAYPGSDADVVSDIHLEIPRNTSIALVGKSGAGKTTLADIIAGLLEPREGAVKIDGSNLRPERIAGWQMNVGYVPQNIYLLDDTVKRNIAFGMPDERIDNVAVWRAARAAKIHEFILRDLESGYDTNLGERGITISGGQRQRIGIARALYSDPEVLILDEATSSLDNPTEFAIMEAIQELARKKTIIVIAHRLSTIQACDTICLMEEGRLTAQGSFTELLNSSRSFRDLCKQARPSSDAVEDVELKIGAPRRHLL
ncbi:MAG: ABC transporter ATP-binding protein [Desulfobacterales bacterium]|nr:ABC transporter ATP-binding protein [Desulfobacterales bacterium]